MHTFPKTVMTPFRTNVSRPLRNGLICVPDLTRINSPLRNAPQLSKQSHLHHEIIDIEDVSDDERESIASAKGQGEGSDLSDSEMSSHRPGNNQLANSTNQQQRTSARGRKNGTVPDPSLKRPSTPLDFRNGTSHPTTQQPNKQLSNRPVESAIKNVRFQQLGSDASMGIVLVQLFLLEREYYK